MYVKEFYSSLFLVYLYELYLILRRRKYKKTTDIDQFLSGILVGWTDTLEVYE